MKSLMKKTLATLGITACAVGAVSSVSFASISWDSSASWVGSGAKASASAYTAKTNEPHYYKMTVSARFNDGSSGFRQLPNASSSDRVNVNFTSSGPVSSGNSSHEWIMVGDSAYTSKVMTIK
ncbi:hypothetical protein JFU18_00325 [Bacillus sp. TH22]|uniref:hypothetical protein n=1 Tax=Bacillus TaxID=1386 RepID=UPI00077B09CE|nr:MULTISPECIES: hypothetical protein [Bacillus]KXY32483.1 hypothetical protein AT269_09600 [Bacillus cereus]MBK5447167.1 hypothetical protein [Bacillus sp. TH22]MBK5453960.1 hypothetical protein [Bacillus sp. TH23]MCQ6567352.1 hypothetical protein [Bacillus mycoides]MED1382864.1 hypothetical protein [Bacillus mycoides]